MSKKQIVVIGGSAADPKATAKARRLDECVDIRFPPFSREIDIMHR
jgi:hypothetical protein